MSEETQSEMFALVISYIKPCMIASALKFDIVDHLLEKTMNAAELALITKTDEANLSRLLRGLVSIGILKCEENDSYSVTKFGETLSSKCEFGIKNLATFDLAEPFFAFGNLWRSIETGEDAFKFTHGKQFYDYMQSSQIGHAFELGMTELGKGHINEILLNYNFSNYKLIVDVGGGRGDFVTAIVRKNKECSGIVFDTKHVIEKIETSLLHEYGGRLKAVSGDFFESVPCGGDCYVMKIVLWNWNDDEALRILQNVYKQMSKGSKLLVIEPSTEKNLGSLLDIYIMLLCGGKVRNKPHLRTLCSKAGLNLDRVIVLPNTMFNINEFSIQ